MIPRILPVTAFCLGCSLLSGQALVIEPGNKPLTLKLSGSCDSIAIKPTTVTIAPPVTKKKSETVESPANYVAAWDNWLPWPRSNKRRTGVITFTPKADENGALMLGVAYKQYPEDQIVITSLDGKTTFVEGEDYKVLTDYGQVANLNGKLGEPDKDKVKVSYTEVEQRLDLIQVNQNGQVSVKQGKSRFVCPYLPEPDAGYTPLAGVYVAPWLTPDSKLTDDFIFPIDPKDPVAPINPQAVAKTRAKLEAGQPVTIAYMGDSLTLGAEAGQWWNDDTQHFRGRVNHALAERYPDAKLTEIKAWKGGRGTEYGVQQLEEVVLPAKPDLLILMMGINDADSSTDGMAKVSPAEYGKHMENIVKSAKDAGIEVIMMTSMQPYPFKSNGHAQRWPEYVSIQEDIAEKYKVGLANTYEEWMNLDSRGIPHYSQMHNWNNHPGSFGHGVMADVTLRFFPGK